MSKQITKLNNLVHLLSPSTQIDINQLIRRIELDQKERWNDPLVTLSRALLNTLLLKEQLQLYRRSPLDINGYDFNWNEKRQGTKNNNYNRTHSLNKHLTRFIKRHDLQGISLKGNSINRQPLGIPSRILAAMDNRALLITLGWCQLNHGLNHDLLHSLIISNDPASSSSSSDSS